MKPNRVQKLIGKALGNEDFADGDGAAAATSPVVINVHVNPETTPEAAEPAIDEAAIASDETESAKAQLDDTAIQLESLVDTLRAAKAKGGLSEDAAGMLTMHYNYLTSRIGLAAPEIKTIPSLESGSWNNSYKRVGATNVSLEAAEGALKTVVAAVKQAIIAAWNALNNFVMQLLSGFKTIAAKAAEMEAAAAKITDNTAATPITTIAGGYLSHGNAFSGQTISTGLTNIQKLANDLFTTYVPAVAGYYDSVAKGVPGNMATITAPLMPAGQEIISGFTFAAEAPETPPSISRTEAKANDQQQIPALTGDEIKAICQLIAAPQTGIAGLFETKAAALGTIKTAVAAALKKLDADAVAAAPSPTGATGTIPEPGAAPAATAPASPSGTMGGPKAAAKHWFRPVTQVGTLAFKCCRAALAVCQLSITARTAPATAPAAAPAAAPAPGTPAPAAAPAAPAAAPAPAAAAGGGAPGALA